MSTHIMKMYFLLQKETFHCHVSLPDSNKFNRLSRHPLIHKFHCQFSCQKCASWPLVASVTNLPKVGPWTIVRLISLKLAWGFNGNTWNEQRIWHILWSHPGILTSMLNDISKTGWWRKGRKTVRMWMRKFETICGLKRVKQKMGCLQKGIQPTTRRWLGWYWCFQK